MLVYYALQEGGKACASRIKAENGKLLVFFCFSLEVENGALRLSREQRANLFALCRCGAAKSLQSRVKAENILFAILSDEIFTTFVAPNRAIISIG